MEYVPGTTIIRPEVESADGNAFAVMAAVAKALRYADVPKSIIEGYRKEAMSSDYDNLVDVSCKYVDFV